MNKSKTRPIIGLVGPCKSGKSVLKSGLAARGYQVRHIAQEHSYVKDMWRKIAQPDILIYLDVSYPVTLDRSSLTWKEHEYEEQLKRLSHARQHANLVIETDDKTPQEILEIVLSYVETN